MTFEKLVAFVFMADLSSQLSMQDYRQEIKSFCKRPNVMSIVASDFNRNKLLTLGISAERIRVIRYALNSGELVPNQTLKTSYPSFVFFGRLTEKKNPVLLIHAFSEVVKELPEARLTLIGSGPLLNDVIDSISSLALGDKIELISGMPRDMAIPIVSKHWIFCQHSVTSFNGDQEGFALSPAEAALLEMPIVSSIHNGIPEHVIHGETGLLAREWDIEGTAAYMLALARNEEMRRKMGEAGRRRVSSLCSPVQRE